MATTRAVQEMALPAETVTAMPTITSTETLTTTPIPTETDTPTSTSLPTHTFTPRPQPTFTNIPTETPTATEPPTPTQKPAPKPTREPSGVLLFASTEVSEDDLFTMDRRGNNRERLTSIGRIGGATYSPDGRQIAFHRIESRKPRYQSDIYVMDADGSALRNLTQTTDRVEFTPDWSPDGNKIVFQSRPPANEYSNLYIMNVDGTGQKLLTDVNDSNQSPSWSPNGKKIAFVSYLEGRGNRWSDKADIFTINIDGSGLVNLTGRGELLSTPIWSPNGQSLLFNRLVGDPSQGEYWQIWRMNADGSNQRCIIGCQGDWGKWSNVVDAWRGNRILFSSWKNGNWDVFIASDDGTGIVQLTDKSADEKAEDWRP
jgi:Tol biopolymer transport system component